MECKRGFLFKLKQSTACQVARHSPFVSRLMGTTAACVVRRKGVHSVVLACRKNTGLTQFKKNLKAVAALIPVKPALLTGTVEKLGLNKFRAFVQLNLTRVPHAVCVLLLHGARALLYIFLSKTCHYFLSTALFFTSSPAYSQPFPHLQCSFSTLNVSDIL